MGITSDEGHEAYEIARAVYSFGLLALGVATLVALPTLLRVLREFTVALRSTAAALQSITADRDQIGRVEAAVGRVEADIAAMRSDLRAACAGARK